MPVPRFWETCVARLLLSCEVSWVERSLDNCVESVVDMLDVRFLLSEATVAFESDLLAACDTDWLS